MCCGPAGVAWHIVANANRYFDDQRVAGCAGAVDLAIWLMWLRGGARAGPADDDQENQATN